MLFSNVVVCNCGQFGGVEKHATESQKEKEWAIKLDLHSFVVETPFH